MWPELPGLLQMAQLSPGLPQAAPTAPVLRDMSAPGPVVSAPAPRASLWDRINSRLMPTPAGFEGLLSPADIAAARKQGLLGLGVGLLSQGYSPVPQTFGQAVAAGVGGMQNAFQNALEGAAQINAFSRQQREAQEDRAKKLQREQQRAEAVEGRMSGVNPDDPRAVAVALNAALGDLLAIGDVEGYRALSGYLAANNALLAGPKTPDLDVYWEDNVDIAGDGTPYKVAYDRNTGRILARVPQFVPPKEPSAAQADIAAQRLFQRENALADDYRTQTRDHATVANYVANMRSGYDFAKRGDAYGQQSMVFAIMKIFDPGSVVRPSEYATAENARGVPEQVRNTWNKLLQGSFLGPEQVERLYQQGLRSAQEWRGSLKPIREQFEKRAREWGVKPENVARDYFGDIDIPTPAGGDMTFMQNNPLFTPPPR